MFGAVCGYFGCEGRESVGEFESVDGSDWREWERWSRASYFCLVSD